MNSNLKYLCNNATPVLHLIYYAKTFIEQGLPGLDTIERVKLIHTDAVLGAFSAIWMNSQVTNFYRQTAFDMVLNTPKIFKFQKNLSTCYGSQRVSFTKNSILGDVCATSAYQITAVGLRPQISGQDKRSWFACDYFAVVTNAQQGMKSVNGSQIVRAMIILEELRFLLLTHFPLCHINSVTHDIISCIIVYGLIIGASPFQIENAVFIYARNFKSFVYNSITEELDLQIQLTMLDNGLSCLHNSISGFLDSDIDYTRPSSAFDEFGDWTSSKFPDELPLAGNDFNIMKKNLRFGVYDFEFASVLDAYFQLLLKYKFTLEYDISQISKIIIIGDHPFLNRFGDKKWPENGLDAQCSPHFVLASVIYKAYKTVNLYFMCESVEHFWKRLMLLPLDYTDDCLKNPEIRKIGSLIEIKSDNEETNHKTSYPDMRSIIELHFGPSIYKSDQIIFPTGHFMNQSADNKALMEEKLKNIGELSLDSLELSKFLKNLRLIDYHSAETLKSIFKMDLRSKKADWK